MLRIRPVHVRSATARAGTCRPAGACPQAEGVPADRRRRGIGPEATACPARGAPPRSPGSRRRPADRVNGNRPHRRPALGGPSRPTVAAPAHLRRRVHRRDRRGPRLRAAPGHRRRRGATGADRPGAGLRARPGPDGVVAGAPRLAAGLGRRRRHARLPPRRGRDLRGDHPGHRHAGAGVRPGRARPGAAAAGPQQHAGPAQRPLPRARQPEVRPVGRWGESCP
jgi:hypothetical protein